MAPIGPRRAAALAVLLYLCTMTRAFSAAQEGASAPDRPATRTLTLAPGVEVVLRPEAGRFDDANSGLIATAAGAIVIDAPADSATVDRIIDRFRDRGGVRYLINTHWHSDHTEGNARFRDAFGDALTIVGHRTLVEDVPGRAAADHQARVERLREQIPAARAALERGKGLAGQDLDADQQAAQLQAIERGESWLAAHGASRFVPPDLAYDRRVDLTLGSVRIELHHFRAHTRGDTVVWLPDAGLLFTGDLLDELPYVGHGTPREWLRALETIRSFPAKRYVPGHGAPLEPGHLDKIYGYLSDLVAAVDAARARGETLEQAQESIDLGVWRRRLATDEVALRFFDGVLADAIESAWREPNERP